MLLGSSRSLGPSGWRGATTLTEITPASGAVAAATRSDCSRSRGTMPMTSSVTSATTPMRTAHPLFDSGMTRLLCEKVLPRRSATQNAVDDRDEEQRGKRGHRQAADHRAAERRVLLAALAEPERHRQHADDHRQRRHEHGAQPRRAGRQRGGARVAALQHLVIRKRRSEERRVGKEWRYVKARAQL